ncbi:MAG TPA: hypothetical protein VMF32_07955 [Xanthobacteraceae bacterium]|nr:hypothetical protein [Xanthobacteraceae bacterium]
MIRSLLTGVVLVAALSSAHAYTRLAADLDVRPYLLNPSRDDAPAAPIPSDAKTSEPQQPLGVEPPGHWVPALAGPAAVERQPKAAPPPAGARSPLPLMAQAAAAPEQEKTDNGISIWALVTFVFYVLVAALAILLGSILVEVLDKALERPWDRSGADSDESATGDFPLEAFLNPRASASAYRREAEVLRAMKEALDAELASVRAQIERERKHAEAMENGKERP